MSTVNEKMTTLANRIRNLSGTTSSLTLDDMATQLNSTSAILHGVNLDLTNLVDLIIDSGIGEAMDGTNPDFPVVEQIRGLTSDLSSNLDQVFHFFNTNTIFIQNNASFPALVYFNAPSDFSFTSIEIPPNSVENISFVQSCVCFIVLNSGMIDISFNSSNNIELITNEVFSNSQHRYMIFRGINTTPKVEATITIAETGGAEEPS